MTCCNVTITPFAAETVTTIAYSGNKPTISVMYLQADGTFLAQGIMTQINIQPTYVAIDHGGAPASGYIKLLQ